MDISKKKEQETLSRFERKIVRHVYGPVKEGDEWRITIVAISVQHKTQGLSGRYKYTRVCSVSYTHLDVYKRQVQLSLLSRLTPR